ncbi:MAG: hypothetical protein WC369_00160 [Dehalococcoidales bacterium]|jgi:hypothetical protein
MAKKKPESHEFEVTWEPGPEDLDERLLDVMEFLLADLPDEKVLHSGNQCAYNIIKHG